MQRSSDRILTTLVGSLPRPIDLRKMWDAKLTGQGHDEATFLSRIKSSSAEMVQRLADTGIDVVSDGEQGRLGWTNYLSERLAGFEDRPPPPGGTQANSRERASGAFAGYFAEVARLRAMGGGREFVPESLQNPDLEMVCVGPVSYHGHEAMEREISNFKAALNGVPVAEAFMPSVGPDNVVYQGNKYYGTQDEYTDACAEAMRTEYQAVIDAGFILQIDTPVMKYDAISMSLEDFRMRFAELVEIINHALRGIPEDRVRIHICYGGGRGPHTGDVNLNEFVDLAMNFNAQGFSYDQDPRHEHEWEIWKDKKLPDGKVLIPGCVGHTNDVIEHPELVKQRIVRLANLVGRENVIASSDCGFAQSVFAPKLHADLVWAKLKSLVEGAELASKELWR